MKFELINQGNNMLSNHHHYRQQYPCYGPWYRIYQYPYYYPYYNPIYSHQTEIIDDELNDMRDILF